MNRGSKVDWNAARSYAIDAAEKNWVAKAVERRAELEAQGLIDSACRFARLELAHECENRDRQPLRPWSTCWLEARAQMREQEAAEQARAADALPLSYEPTPGLPEYRMVQP